MKKLSQMTLAEKLQQMSQTCAVYLNKDTQAAQTGSTDDVIDTQMLRGIGSILNFDGADQMKALSDFVVNGSTHKIPPIFMHDVIHGYKLIYPIPLALAGSFDEQLVHDCCKMAAEEAVLNGVQVTFAPMVDLCRDARWGRVMESPGEDPYLNGVMGKVQIRGFRAGGLLTCVKHFACYGACQAGRDYSAADMSDFVLNEYYLRPYRECLKENPEMVMTSFNVLNGKPVNANKHIMLDILRKKWKYNGVVISDYDAVVELIPHGFAEDKSKCAKVCVENQVDIEMVSTAYMQTLPKLVEQGEVSQKVIDKSVRRILRLKQKANLPKCRRLADSAKAQKYFEDESNRELTRIAAERSIVLLKNDGVLPLKNDEEVALAGSMVAEKDILGAWSCFGDSQHAVSVQDGIKNVFEKAPVCLQDVQNCKQNVVIVCIGEQSRQSGESRSRAHLKIDDEQLAMVQKLHATGTKVVAVIFAGRPLVLTKLQPYCNAILYAWFPGIQGGNAIANILCGKANPSAKLAMSFPRAVGQCPVCYSQPNTGRPKADDDVVEQNCYCSCYIDELNKPLYPFGYGLSYTTFALSRARLVCDEANGKKLHVTVDITNTGDVCGRQVVQLYISDKFASYVRPIKELKGFCNVQLSPKQTKTVSFAVTEEMFAFYKDGEFVAEDGEFEIFVGFDSTCTESVKFVLDDKSRSALG